DEAAHAALALDDDRRLRRRGLRARRGGSGRRELDRLRGLSGAGGRLARRLRRTRSRRREWPRLRRLRPGGRILLSGPGGWLGLGHFESAPPVNSLLRLAFMVMRPSRMARIADSSTPASARPIRSSASAPRLTSIGAALSVR